MKHSSEIPSVAPYSKEKFEAWRQRHGNDAFSGQWNRILAQRSRDPSVSDEDRFLCWLTLNAAGNFSDYPVYPDGREKFQTDCVKETGMNKRRVSEAVMASAIAGYVIVPDRKGRFADGSFGPPGRLIQADGRVAEAALHEANKEQMSLRHVGLAYANFKKTWLEQNPEKQRVWAEATAIIDAIDYEILTEWNRLKEEENAADGENKANNSAEDDSCEPDGEERANNSAEGDSGESGHVGPNVRTVRTKSPDKSDKTGVYPYNVEISNKKNGSSSLRSSSTGSGITPETEEEVRSLVKVNGKQTEPNTAILQWFRNVDPTAEPAQIEDLVRECQAATKVSTGVPIPPADLLGVLQLWPLEGAKSAYAVMRRRLPSLLRDPERFRAWIQKRTTNPDNDPTKARDAETLRLFEQLMKKGAAANAS